MVKRQRKANAEATGLGSAADVSPLTTELQTDMRNIVKIQEKYAQITRG